MNNSEMRNYPKKFRQMYLLSLPLMWPLFHVLYLSGRTWVILIYQIFFVSCPKPFKLEFYDLNLKRKTSMICVWRPLLFDEPLL